MQPTHYERLGVWTGGPPKYADRFGPTFLRRRHTPFSIDEPERDPWMGCMVRAMPDVVGRCGDAAETDGYILQNREFHVQPAAIT